MRCTVMTGSRAIYKFLSHDGTELHSCWHRPLGIRRGNESPVALVAHALGKKGGSMDNPLILHLCDVANLCNVIAFRFNFRGVQPSHGFGSLDGESEREDARSAIDEALKFYSEVVLVGYDYGAFVWGSVLEEFLPCVAGFVAVSYPLALLPTLTPHCQEHAEATIRGVSKLVARSPITAPAALFIHGENDDISCAQCVPSFYPLTGAKVVVIPKADHYWREKKFAADLSAVLGPFLSSVCRTKYNTDLSLLGFRP